MYEQFHIGEAGDDPRDDAGDDAGDEIGGPSPVSTGRLPQADFVQAVVNEAHERYRSVAQGAVANYIPALARTPAKLFGLCLTAISGAAYAAGDAAARCGRQQHQGPARHTIPVAAARPQPVRIETCRFRACRSRACRRSTGRPERVCNHQG